MFRVGLVGHACAVAVAFGATAMVDEASAQLNPCHPVVVANPGVVVVCPKGDGDPLFAAIGGANSQISLTMIAYGDPVPGIPAEDMWLVGCSNGLLLCGLSSGSNADAATDAQGHTTFSNEPIAGGCETGLYVVVQGFVIQDPNNSCQPLCVPIKTRSPDYKSSGAPGPPPCAGDTRCPDSRVTNADFSWFVTHYPSVGNPGASYFECADFAAPLGAPLGLADFSKFSLHFWGDHKCPI